MKSREFMIAVNEEFGDDCGRVLLRDLILSGIGDQTAEQALASGRSPREVWLALCDAMSVPEDRRHGRGRPDPRR